MSDENGVDINKEFENLLFVEENAQSIGYEEGYATGKQQLIKGYHLGYHRASLIGAQLGYYCGVLEQYLNADKPKSKRAVFIAKELLQDISNFPKFNSETVNFFESIDTIKFKYAKFCALTKICSLYPETDKLEF